jgi:hypothetical protein
LQITPKGLLKAISIREVAQARKWSIKSGGMVVIGTPTGARRVDQPR